MSHRRLAGIAVIASLLVTASCAEGAGADDHRQDVVAVTVRSAGGTHVFKVDVADTAAEQARGLMYRTDLKSDDGMLFAPYPPDGGSPREASFWMRNTPSPLDIIFIRADGTIARIAENTAPFSEAPVASGEPVAAVLEVPGGRSAELGIAEGDRVDWPGRSH